MAEHKSHNPCFSGILFAIEDSTGDFNSKNVTILVLVEYSLQLNKIITNEILSIGHNPCFSGILFAIIYMVVLVISVKVTILVLVEYSLQ